MHSTLGAGLLESFMQIWLLKKNIGELKAVKILHDTPFKAPEAHCMEKKWFGFTLHLIVDTKYELPVSFTMTKASKNEMPIAHMLLSRLERGNKDTPLINYNWNSTG